MIATITQELAEHPELIYRVTVTEYHEMIANGTILSGEPFELFDGEWGVDQYTDKTNISVS